MSTSSGPDEAKGEEIADAGWGAVNVAPPPLPETQNLGEVVGEQGPMGAFAGKTNTRGALIAGITIILGLVAVIWVLVYRHKPPKNIMSFKFKFSKKR